LLLVGVLLLDRVDVLGIDLVLVGVLTLCLGIGLGLLILGLLLITLGLFFITVLVRGVVTTLLLFTTLRLEDSIIAACALPFLVVVVPLLPVWYAVLVPLYLL